MTPDQAINVSAYLLSLCAAFYLARTYKEASVAQEKPPEYYAHETAKWTDLLRENAKTIDNLRKQVADWRAQFAACKKQMHAQQELIENLQRQCREKDVRIGKLVEKSWHDNQ